MKSRCLLLLCVVCGLFAARADAAESAKFCTDAEYRKFDFWIGDWDTFDEPVTPASKSVARNHVDAVLDGCAIHEDYDQFDGHHGRSFTIYDAARKVWHQSWVTNRGELLVLEGTRSANRITLEGDEAGAKGRRRVRVFWEPQGGDVRETATVSADGGKTWRPLFDILFRRHKE
ncbi:MAG: hypothetical protein QM741_01380 [Rudaea sp.]|uniref:hypothetical protein n=1 Tax=Rudaea sp. TaxID=2136325 RepID=UPI0039E5F369